MRLWPKCLIRKQGSSVAPTVTQPPNLLDFGKEEHTSRWTITIGDTSALAMPYLLATAHYFAFNHLHHKRVGIDTRFSQSWVSAISILVVIVFRLCLSLALGNACTQHLWRIIRLKPVKVADLDTYFSMPKDPLALLQWRILITAPTLYVMAFLGIFISTAVIFPPGALTIEGKMYKAVHTQSVGYFDASFMGNGSINDALDRSLLQRSRFLLPPYFATKPIVSTTAKMTLIAGALPKLASPCGPNCTYTVGFDGPRAKCSVYKYKDTATIAVPNFKTIALPGSKIEVRLPDWTSDWTPVDPKSFGDVYVDCPTGEVGAHCTVNTYYENIFFEWYSYDDSNTTITRNSTTAMYPRSVTRLECIPSYGRYNVNITFDNGVPVVQINSTYIGSLVELWRSSGRHISKAEGLEYWLDPQGLLKTANLFAVVTSFIEPLKGMISSAHTLDVFYDGTIRFGDNSIYDTVAGGSMPLVSNETSILDTAFVTERFNLEHDSNWKIGVLDITEKKINSALQNITMALMILNSNWNTTVNVTQGSYQNVYSFSPLPLVIPYACCILLVLPFLVLGYYSLQSNGVPAISGGFVQTLMTTTGSKSLRDAAAAGCLGGQHNLSRELKDMEIMYGELRTDDDDESSKGRVKRAAFGLESEIGSLTKGDVYGR